MTKLEFNYTNDNITIFVIQNGEIIESHFCDSHYEAEEIAQSVHNEHGVDEVIHTASVARNFWPEDTHTVS